MSVEASDLLPKPFTVEVRGVQLTCQPLRLSQIILITKVGKVFQSVETATREEIKQAEADLDEVIGDVIPELKGKQLDAYVSMELVQQLVESVEPADNKELKENGVTLNTDPKARTEKTG